MKKLFLILAAVCLTASVWAEEPSCEFVYVGHELNVTLKNMHCMRFNVTTYVYNFQGETAYCWGELYYKDITGEWMGVAFCPQANKEYCKATIGLPGFITIAKSAQHRYTNEGYNTYYVCLPYDAISHPAGHVDYKISLYVEDVNSKKILKNKKGGYCHDYFFSLNWPEEWPKKVRIEDAIEEPKVEPKKESKVSITNEDWKQIDKAEWEFESQSLEVDETNIKYIVSVDVEQDMYSSKNRLKVSEYEIGWFDIDDLYGLTSKEEVIAVDNEIGIARVMYTDFGYNLTKASQAFVIRDDLGDVAIVDTCNVIEIRDKGTEFHCAEKCVQKAIADFSAKYHVINKMKPSSAQRKTYVYQLGSTVREVREHPHVEINQNNPNSLTKYTTPKDWRKDCKTDPAQFGTIIKTHKLSVATKRYDMATKTINESRRDFTVYLHNTDNNNANFERISIGDGSGYYYEVATVATVTLHILGRLKDSDVKTLKMDQILVETPYGKRIIANGKLAQFLLSQINSKQNHSKIERYPNDHFYYQWHLTVDGMMTEIKKP